MYYLDNGTDSKKIEGGKTMIKDSGMTGLLFGTY